jgi:acetyl esterase/lipase
MPVAKLDKFREDIRKFLKIGAAVQANICNEYIMNKAPEIETIWPKVAENNEKLFKGEVTINEVWTVITREEMLAMAGMLRHMVERTAAMRMEQNPLPQGVRIESVDTDGVPVEWQSVAGSSEEKALLYLHGGGWILGSAYTYRPLTVALGKATEMQVFSVNYRLAPENPFPAGLEDCTKAYRWLMRQGFKPSNIIIAGDSAGGNLTLATILKLRDAKIPFPKGAVCLSPATNLKFHTLFSSRGETDPILADIGIFWWISAYLGTKDPAGLENALVSPFFGDLRGFPPLLVQATPLELLFEGARQFVEKVKAAGGEATLQTWDGMVHVWQLFFIDAFPESREAIDKIGEWVKKLYE